MSSPTPKDIFAFILKIAAAVSVLFLAQDLIEDTHRVSQQSQQLERVGASLAKRVVSIEALLFEHLRIEQPFILGQEQSYDLYRLGKTISYLNDIIARAQGKKRVVEQVDDLDSDLLPPYENRILEQQAVYKWLLGHLKQERQLRNKRKILNFCKNNPTSETQIKDLLLHSSSFSLSYFPNQAEEKSASSAAARYQQRISNQYRIKAREHEKLHFCIFLEAQEEGHFSYEASLQSIISQDYDRVKVIIINKAHAGHTAFLIHSFLKKLDFAKSKFIIVAAKKDETQAQYLFHNMPLYCQADDIVLTLRSGDEIIGKRSFLLINEVLRGEVSTLVHISSLSIGEADDSLRKIVTPSIIKPDQARRSPQIFESSAFFFKASSFLQLRQADLKDDGSWLTGRSVYIVPMIEMACSKLTFLGEFMILQNERALHDSGTAQKIQQKQPYRCVASH